MNKKKIIFLIVLAIFVILIIIVAVFMSKSTEKNKKSTAQASNFNIWILEKDKDKFNNFLESFKSDTDNTNLTINVETFSDYETYNKALASAIIKGEAPDLYMLNSGEKSIFLEQAIGLDPEKLSVDSVRKEFYPFFGDDLIFSSGEKEEKTEFLVGIPFGYETLGLYFNLSRVNDIKKMKSFPEIENLIEDFHKRKPDLVALGIGKGESVLYSSDIITQFLMAEGVSKFSDINSSNIKKAFSEYFAYNSGNNSYAKFDEIMKKQNKTNLNYFVDGDIAMIFGYPRMLNSIEKLGFSKRLLRVVNFPDFINDSNKFVNYNYFVLNKDSQNIDAAYSLLQYIFSEKGEKALLKEYPYYLPARISLYDDLKDRQINDNFHVKLKDFYNPEAIYSSFNKGIKNIYEENIKNLLDSEENYVLKASRFINSLVCKTKKIIKLENLSEECE